MKVDIDTSDKLYAIYNNFKGTAGKTKLMSAILFNITIPYEGDESFSTPSGAATTLGKSNGRYPYRKRNPRAVDFDTNVPPQLPLMMQDILTSRWKKLLACKRMRR